MNSKINKKSWFKKILALAGFHTFLFTLGPGNTLVIITCFLMTAVLFLKLKYKKSHMDLLFPLSAGLLCFLIKLFYWDRPDYINRVETLLLLALLFSLVITLRKHRILKKFLFFFNRLPLKKRLTGIFITAEILFILSALIITWKGVELGGDEPHYLVISHSIARDFDLNVFNQYAREEYRDIIDVRMRHHARVGKGFKVWYSYGHLPGLSLTLAPFFLVKIPPPLLYVLIRSYLGLFGALIAVLVYLFALKLWRSASLAIFISTVFTLTAPVFFFSIHVFAELQALLLILSSLYLILYSQKSRPLLAGFLLGISVFWGLKYAIFIYIFSAGFFLYFTFKKRNLKKALLFVLFPVIFQLIFFGYLYYAYGNFNPMSIYTGIMTDAQAAEYQSNVQKIPLLKRIETLLGTFFDQRDGLLLYNPFYLLFFPGLILALKKFRIYLPHLLISAAAFVYVLFIGYSTVRAGYCPQARYLVPVMWAIMLFAVIYYKETRNRPLKKIALYLPVYSVLVVIYQVFYPFTLYQSATHNNLDRPGLMFQQWSNLHINLPDLLPSFVKVPGNFTYLPNVIFLVLLLVFIFFSLQKVSALRLKFSAGWGLSILFAILFVVSVLFPKIPAYNPIDITREDTPPYKIYGESRYPTRALERKFELLKQEGHVFTVSTAKPAPFFVFEFENQNNGDYDVSVFSFDRRVKKTEIPARAVRKISIKNPRYKRFKDKCFYRFHLKITPSPAGMPSLYFQLYPFSKSMDTHTDI